MRSYTVVVLAVFALCTSAQNVGLRSNESEVSNDFFRQVQGGSKLQPFTTVLKKNDDAAKLYKELGEWFEATSADVRRRRTSSDGSECTLRGQPWIDEAKNYVDDRVIPTITKSCATRTEHEHSNLTRANNLLIRTYKVLKSVGEDVIRTDPILMRKWKNASKVESIHTRNYIKDDQTCSINFLAGIRVKGKWYIASALTDKPANQGGKRFRTVEHVASDLSAALWMRLTEGKRPEKKFLLTPEPNFQEDAYTTTFADLSGASQISRIHRMQMDDNRALTNALEENILAVDQANDAITPANLAILILPLFMSFIPVALIADLSEIATFFYVLLTDVFAAVPFVIKGVELVITGTSVVRSSETWLVGNDDEVQVAETWIAECQPLTHFRNTGIIVIAVGLASILCGILIEHFARAYMNAKRDKGENPEPFGPALLRMDAYIPVGANYMPPNANYDDALAPNIAADLQPPPVAAPGPPHARITNLFSGILRRGRRRGHRGHAHAAEDASPFPEPTADQLGIVQPPPAGVRRRSTAVTSTASASSPQPAAEYETP